MLASCDRNSHDPNAANFAILDQMEKFRTDGKFKFKLPSSMPF